MVIMRVKLSLPKELGRDLAAVKLFLENMTRNMMKRPIEMAMMKF